MGFYDLTLKRQSTRKYSDKKAVREDIISCIKMAVNAPSASNSQPWKYIIVDDESKVKEMCEAVRDDDINANTFSRQVSTYVVITGERGVRENEHNLSDKQMEELDYERFDIGATTNYFCLAAAEKGIDTIILGWFSREQVRTILNIPADKEPAIVVAVGYSATGTTRRKTRKDIDEILSVNSY